MPRPDWHIPLYCVVLLLSVISGRGQEILPFGNAFPPSFSFVENYDESAAYSGDDEDFVETTSYSLRFESRVSMAGIDRTTFDSNTHLLRVLVGNLDVWLPFAEGTRTTVAGARIIRWFLEGLDPNTFEDLPRAGTVELRYDAEALTVSLVLDAAWEDYSIIAPDLGETEGPVNTTLPLAFTVGSHGFSGRVTYVRGMTEFYDLTVQHAGIKELFADLARVHLTGEIDSTKPNVQIIEPRVGQQVMLPTVTIWGTASDDHTLTSVSVKVNGGDFVPATLNMNGTWTLADVTLQPGDNFVLARSFDADGNSNDSPLHTFRYVILSTLSVTAEGTGPGTITSDFFVPLTFIPTQPPTTRTAQREVGSPVTLVALAGADTVFDGWVANVPLTPEQISSPELIVAMQPDMTLTARFLRNPFAPVRGGYSGLIQSADYADRGVLAGKLTANGTFTLLARIGRLAIPVKGEFSNAGEFDSTVFVEGSIYTIHLRLNVSGVGQRQITGLIRGGTIDATLTADLSTYSKRLNPVPPDVVGTYNVLIPAAEENTDARFPIGTGFGRLSIIASGMATFAGTLGDGSEVACGATIAGEATQSERYFPLFAPLYRQGGSISGRLIIDTTQPAHDVSGVLDWHRPAGARPRNLHGEGFSGKSSLVGAKFIKGGAGQLAFLQETAGAGTLRVQAPASRGLQPLDATTPCLVTASSVVANPSAVSGLRASILSFNPRSGLLSGSISELGTSRDVKGLIVPRKLNRGGGLFIRGAHTGRIEISAAP